MEALVEQCMADYDENGWVGGTWMSDASHGGAMPPRGV
jgi:4-hydroxyphenylacetate 3-monooxygenase